MGATFDLNKMTKRERKLLNINKSINKLNGASFIAIWCRDFDSRFIAPTKCQISPTTSFTSQAKRVFSFRSYQKYSPHLIVCAAIKHCNADAFSHRSDIYDFSGHTVNAIANWSAWRIIHGMSVHACDFLCQVSRMVMKIKVF